MIGEIQPGDKIQTRRHIIASNAYSEFLITRKAFKTTQNYPTRTILINPSGKKTYCAAHRLTLTAWFPGPNRGTAQTFGAKPTARVEGEAHGICVGTLEHEGHTGLVGMAEKKTQLVIEGFLFKEVFPSFLLAFLSLRLKTCSCCRYCSCCTSSAGSLMIAVDHLVKTISVVVTLCFGFVKLLWPPKDLFYCSIVMLLLVADPGLALPKGTLAPFGNK